MAKAIASAACRTALKTLRLFLYVLLLLAGRVIVPLGSVMSGGGLFAFLFFALFRRDLPELMWGSAGLALAGGLVSIGYVALVQRVAPEGEVIVSDV